MIKKLNLAVGIAVLSMCPLVQAEISVNPLLVFFVGGSTVQDITVDNLANEIAYVAVTPSAVQNPGTASEKVVPYQLGADASNFGLMVSPLKMSVPASSSRKVRVVSLKATPAQDEIYYLNFNQVASLMANNQASDSGTNIQMSNQVSYKVQVIVLPAQPLPVINATRQGSEVTIKNTGNSYASLRNGQLCNASGADCAPLPAGLSYKVLYAGNTWAFTEPKPGVVKFDVVYARDKKMQAASN